MDVNEIQEHLPSGQIPLTLMKEGEYRKVAPLLREQGYDVVSPAWVMDTRNASVHTPAEKVLWKETWFDTDFGVASRSSMTMSFTPLVR